MTSIPRENIPLPPEFIEAAARVQARWEGTDYLDYYIAVLRAACIDRLNEIRKSEGVTAEPTP